MLFAEVILICWGEKVNSLTTKMQTTKFSSANFLKMLSPSYVLFAEVILMCWGEKANSLTTKKQATKFSSTNLKKKVKSKLGQTVDLDEVLIMSHLIKIHAVCKFSSFCLWYLKS